MTVGLMLAAIWFVVVAVVLVRQYLTDAFAVEVQALELAPVEAVELPAARRLSVTAPAA